MGRKGDDPSGESWGKVNNMVNIYHLIFSKWKKNTKKEKGLSFSFTFILFSVEGDSQNVHKEK